ncbi:MAG: TRAP transporter substrate-binding protein, partial [Elioraea sp.]|nr:TRAP transporter substrate-binding protein [Elioraea sp.]
MKFAPWLGAAALAFAGQATAQIVLNASSWVPPTHPITATMLTPLCQDIEKATAGRVKCNILAKAPVGAVQTFDGVRDGLMDLSFTVHGYTPGRFTLTEAVEFPFMADSSQVMSVAYQRVHERMLAKADEHKGVVALAVFTHGPGQIYHATKPIASLADLKGQKIRVGGGLINEITKALGAVPLLRPAPEVFEILKTGVADGVFFPKESVGSFKLTPVLKHATFVPGGLYNVSFVWIANPAKWNSIPAADRKLIEPLLGDALALRS